jgi:hypothetical protein
VHQLLDVDCLGEQLVGQPSPNRSAAAATATAAEGEAGAAAAVAIPCCISSCTLPLLAVKCPTNPGTAAAASNELLQLPPPPPLLLVLLLCRSPASLTSLPKQLQ